MDSWIISSVGKRIVIKALPLLKNYYPEVCELNKIKLYSSKDKTYPMYIMIPEKFPFKSPIIRKFVAFDRHLNENFADEKWTPTSKLEDFIKKHIDRQYIMDETISMIYNNLSITKEKKYLYFSIGALTNNNKVEQIMPSWMKSIEINNPINNKIFIFFDANPEQNLYFIQYFEDIKIRLIATGINKYIVRYTNHKNNIVIYVFRMYLKSSHMSEERFHNILETFDSLPMMKQWKSFENLLSNVIENNGKVMINNSALYNISNMGVMNKYLDEFSEIGHIINKLKSSNIKLVTGYTQHFPKSVTFDENWKEIPFDREID